MRGDVVERAIPLPAVEAVVTTGLANHARARAVAAVSGAEAGREEQHAIRITMHETRYGGVVIFAQRIVGFAG